MRKSKKILLAIIGVIALAVIGWFAYYLLHFVFYNDYRQYLSSYEVEEGTELKVLPGGGDVEGYALVAENDTLKLYAQTETGNVAVYDKRNGNITYSNPLKTDEDTYANSEANRNYLKSQLIISYINESKTEGTMDSYSFCVARDQMKVESIADGVRFIYQIGDLESATGIVPQYISGDTLERILALMPEADAKFTKLKYKESGVADNYFELLEATMNGPSQLRKLNSYFEAAGFTIDDYNREMEGSGMDFDPPISITIPLDYKLNADAVDVSIPMKAVVETGGGYLYKIQLLRFFGAGTMNESGYLLVPNGAGSIIKFNNGKTTAENYVEYVYGIDPLTAEYTVKENTDNSRMALFGIFKDSKNAIFATIEDGAANSLITAGVSGTKNGSECNNAYPTFVVRGTEKLAMFGTTGSEADLPIIEKDLYDSTITVKYTLLTGEDATYAGAANYYRNKLIGNGTLKEKAADGDDIKMYYDVIAGVGKTEFFLGVQYQGMYEMTTFDEAAKISDDLVASGITNQVMNLQGWMNDGYYHDATRKVDIHGSLGGRGGLENLNKKLLANGGKLYTDVAFQKVTEADHFYPNSNETSRYYASGYVAEFGMVNPATLRQTAGLGYEDNRFYLVSPKFVPRYVDIFLDKMNGVDVSGYSLRDLGSELHSDKRRTNVINREQALDVVTGLMAKMDESGKDIMVSGGNDYTFAYAEDIINVPVTDNDYYIIDEEVPFYEMLIHGCIDYSGTLINMNDSSDPDRRDQILDMIEAGASPHFVFTWKNSSEIKKTALNWYYSTTYENWKDMAVKVYSEVNAALKDVKDAQIVNHEILSNEVRIVTYSNGVKIYINRSDYNRYADGMMIPANGYVIGGVR
ncbi:MAG: hypothetical protein KBS85_01880 [Lachnospiraceae bacterium]|nr:hypothetical protein [Candidatus Merdinaster equi]